MRGKIAKSLFTIGLVAAGTVLAGTQAAFTDTVEVQNNTFVTGNADLKLYYDCWLDPLGVTPAGLAVHQDTRVEGSVAVVECPANNMNGYGVGGRRLDDFGLDRAGGEWEHAALAYTDADNLGVGSYDDGGTQIGSEIFNYEGPVGGFGTQTGDWTTTNGWWDALSSPMDWTNVYPGWSTHGEAVDSIQLYDSVAVDAGEGDILSLGNAGSVPFNDILIEARYEALGEDETAEPQDEGWLDTNGDGVGDTFVGGGDRVDPLSDGGWTDPSLGIQYGSALGQYIYVQIEHVRAGGGSSVVWAGTYADLVAAAPVSTLQTLGEVLDADEVTYFRFNWEMDSNAPDSMQDRMFDFEVTFTGTT